MKKRLYTLTTNMDKVIYQSNPLRPWIPSRALATLGEIAVVTNAQGLVDSLTPLKLSLVGINIPKRVY